MSEDSGVFGKFNEHPVLLLLEGIRYPFRMLYKGHVWVDVEETLELVHPASVLPR
jgi:hypothetical protein